MTKKISILVLFLFLFVTLCYGAEKDKRVIVPIENAEDIKPLSAPVWEKLYNLPEYKKFRQP